MCKKPYLLRSAAMMAVFGAMFVWFPPFSHSAVYHVDSAKGADSRDGLTPGRAWKTIQRAADAAAPGDTVRVHPGRYGRTVVTRSGKPGMPVVFRGVEAPVVVFPGDGAPVGTGNAVTEAVYDGTNARLENPGRAASTAGFDISGSHVRIENFEITAIPAGSKSAIFLRDAAGVVIAGNYIHELCGGLDRFDYWDGISGRGGDITVTGNVLWRVEGTGIRISGTGWRVEGNDISHGSNRRWTDGIPVCEDTDAVRFFGHGHIIRKNYLHHYLRAETDGKPHTDCIQSFTTAWEPESFDILIEWNTCYHITGGQGIMIEGGPFPEGKMHHITIRGNILDTTAISYPTIIKRVHHLTVVNNVFANSSGWGLLIGGNSRHATVLNNIFYRNTSGSGFAEEAGTTGSVWDYNINFPDYSWPKKKPGCDTHGLFGVDPAFVNPEARDYHLRPGSPAIDRGADAGLVRDPDGVPIPRGGAPDIGAYEFTGGAAETSP